MLDCLQIAGEQCHLVVLFLRGYHVAVVLRHANHAKNLVENLRMIQGLLILVDLGLQDLVQVHLLSVVFFERIQLVELGGLVIGFRTMTHVLLLVVRCLLHQFHFVHQQVVHFWLGL